MPSPAAPEPGEPGLRSSLPALRHIVLTGNGGHEGWSQYQYQHSNDAGSPPGVAVGSSPIRITFNTTEAKGIRNNEDSQAVVVPEEG